MNKINELCNHSTIQKLKKTSIRANQNIPIEKESSSKELEKFKIEPFYYFMIFCGNNDQILRTTLRQRGNFSEVF